MYNISIPNMLNGVSQQPPTVRFPSQCSILENAYASPTESLTKRYPTEVVTDWTRNGEVHGKLHIIDRGDGTEAYTLSIFQDGIKAYDILNNTEVSVTAPSGWGYLGGGDAENLATDLSLTTIGDYTFICNRNKTILMSAHGESDDSPQALTWVKTGNYGMKYAIEIKLIKPDGTVRDSITASYKTQTTTDAGTGYTETQESLPTGLSSAETFPIGTAVIDTSYIAGKLMAEIQSKIAARIGTYPEWGNLTIVRLGYTIRYNLGVDLNTYPNMADFEIVVQDGMGGNGLVPLKDKVQQFEDLTVVARDGMLIKVEGLPEEAGDDYYVRFSANSPNTGSSLSEGVWVESRPKQIDHAFNPSTMPHALIRKFDQSGDPYFVFTPIDGSANANDSSWDEMLVGDSYTNPQPSFVGAEISSIFGFQGRLGILSGESVVLSESGNFFNFWRTTVASLLDTDPIDVYSAYPQITVFRYGIPFGNRLILFSDKAQMALYSPGDSLTPSSVVLEPVSRYECVSNCMPTLVGEEIYFAFLRGEYVGVRDMVANIQDATLLTAPEITGHVPKYIFGTPIEMAASPFDRTMLLRTDRNPSTLFVYKWFDSGNERIQSSWSSWVFNGVQVLSFGWFQSKLYLLTWNGAEYGLRVMDVRENRTDPGSAICTRLDNRRLIPEGTASNGQLIVNGYFGSGSTPEPPPSVSNTNGILFIYGAITGGYYSNLLTDEYVINPGQTNVVLGGGGLTFPASTAQGLRRVEMPYVRMQSDTSYSGQFSCTAQNLSGTSFNAPSWSNNSGLTADIFVDGSLLQTVNLKTQGSITQSSTPPYPYIITGTVEIDSSPYTLTFIWSMAVDDETTSTIDRWGGSWSVTVSGPAASIPISVSVRFNKTRTLTGPGTLDLVAYPTAIRYTNFGSSPINVYAGVVEEQGVAPLLTLAIADGASAGAEIEILDSSYNPATGQTTFSIPEDAGSPTMYLGYRYDMVYRFSPVYLRTGQDRSALTSGRYQIRNINVVYDESGPFTAKVSPVNPLNESSYTYPRGSVGSTSFINSPVESGTIRIPVMAKPDQVHVDLINDTPYPSRFVSAEVEVSYEGRFRRI